MSRGDDAFDFIRRYDDQVLVARLLGVAFVLADVFDTQSAAVFMKSPQKILDGAVPLDLCETEDGFLRVLNVALAIANGDYL